MTERAELPTVDATEPVPRYEDEDAEALGEKLAELYTRRDLSGDGSVAGEIEKTRRDLRRGPRLRAGEFLKDGRYRLVERLGDSAGDATWLAWDRQELRQVVVKEMVGPWVAKRMRVGTFLEAARTLQQLEHPGLAPLHEATQSREGFVYLALDHLTGGRLDRFEGDATDVLQAVVEVASALQVAHDAGLIHARVRPEAVFFDDSGAAKITDFDLAGEHVHGDSGSVYVAPELVERGAQATPAADVYALAMSALYALNGNRLPYTVVRGPDRFIDALDVAGSVKTVLKKAVDWELEYRYPSMSALVKGLLADPEVLSELAERALAQSRFEIAAGHFSALRELMPDDQVRIQHVLGSVYLATGAHEEAYEALAGAVEATDRPEEVFPDLRRWAESTGDHKRVADLLWNQARNRPAVARAAMRAELAWITEEHLGDARGASEVWTLVVQDHRTVERGRQALTALKRLAEQREDWAGFVDHARELLAYLDPEERPEVQYAIGRALIVHLRREDEGLLWIDRAEAGGVLPLDLASVLADIRARRGQWRRLIGLMRLQAEHEDHVHQASRILLRAATIARAVHLEVEAEAIYGDILARAPQHYPALRELARIRHRSGRSEAAMEAYEQLTSTYEGRSEPPEATERAADHTAYARLLTEKGRDAEALDHLAAALELQPDNVEALCLIGPLQLDTGHLEEGATALEALYTLFRAVDTRGARLDTALQRADAAWYRGRLAVGMRWYNVVHGTRDDDDRAWWGLARIALAARGGHPGTDRAPWLSSTPAGFTFHEALARYLMGQVEAEAMQGWLGRVALGLGAVEAGATPVRLACLTVDLLDRYGLIDEAFFARLTEARPETSEQVELLRGLWDGSVEQVDQAAIQAWSGNLVPVELDLTVSRHVVAVRPRKRTCTPAALKGDEAWAQLLGGSAPDLEEEPSSGPTSPATPEFRPSGLELQAGGVTEQVFPADLERVVIGSAPACHWVLDGLEPRHAALQRIGRAIYVEALDGAVRVDGNQVPGWRVMGDESLTLGPCTWRLVVEGQEPDEVPAPEPSEGPAEPSLPAEPYDDDADVTQAAMPRLSEEQLQRALAEAEGNPTSWEDGLLEEEPDEALSDDDLDGLADGYADEPAADGLDGAPPWALEPEPEELVDADTLSSETPEAEPVEDDFEPVSLAGESGIDDEPMPATEFPMESLPDEPVEAFVEEVPAADEPAEQSEEPAQSEEPEEKPVALGPPPGHQFGQTIVALADLEEDDEDDSADETVEVDQAQLEEVARLAELQPVRAPSEEFVDPETVSDVGTVEMDRPDRAGQDEEATATLPSPGQAGGYQIGLDHPPIEPSRPASSEDSLGPAGDAPTPQWLAADSIDEELVATHLYREEPEPEPAPPAVLEPEPEQEPEPVAPPPAPPDAVEPPAPVPPATPKKQGVLEVMSGPSRGTKMAVIGVLTLGRKSSCELHLPADPMLSEVHCRFTSSEAGFMVVDNGSDRGTMVDGCRVSETALQGGETIMVGSTVLRFVIRG